MITGMIGYPQRTKPVKRTKNGKIQRSSKYKNKKTEIFGIKFDSKKEAERYIHLKAKEKNGEITGLKRQVRYELIPSQRINGKVVERKCDYVADFVYFDELKKETVVEDVKSKATRTSTYIIKRKLMLQKYGIRIKEV